MDTPKKTESGLSAIRSRMIRGDTFDWTEVAGWIQSEDFDLMGAAYEVLTATESRIQGSVDPVAAEHVILRYLVLCIEDTPEHGRSAVFDLPPHIAANSLAAWYVQLRAQGRGRHDPLLVHIRQELARICTNGTERQRMRVVNGALEHIFETRCCRDDFVDWCSNSSLASAYTKAMEWVS